MKQDILNVIESWWYQSQLQLDGTGQNFSPRGREADYSWFLLFWSDITSFFCEGKVSNNYGIASELY